MSDEASLVENRMVWKWKMSLSISFFLRGGKTVPLRREDITSAEIKAFLRGGKCFSICLSVTMNGDFGSPAFALLNFRNVW